MGKALLHRKIGERFPIITVHPCANSTEPDVSIFIFQNRKNMKAFQALFFCKIGKGIPIVTNNSLPGGKPNVPFSILQDIASDAAGAEGGVYGFGFYKIRVTIRQTTFRLAYAVFWRVGFVLLFAGRDKNKQK